MDPAYAAPGTEAYEDPTAADQQYASDGGAGVANGWYGEQSAVTVTDPAAAAAPIEQQGFSIPTTGQTNGGGPMRQGRGGGSRFNPMGRGKPGAGDGMPASSANAEKNELGYIIFAYNIGYQTDEGQLHALFQPYGTVAKVNVIQDFATGQGKGFGFVTMPNAQEAETAINSLNGSDFNGNTLQIRFKTPKGQGPPPGVRGNRGGGFGFRGGQRGGGFRGARGIGMRGGGYRGRGAPRGVGGRGRGRGGAYSSAPSAYDGYGYQPAPATGYDQYAYADPNAGAYGAQATGYETYDPYAAAGYGAAAGTGYASYGAAGAQQW